MPATRRHADLNIAGFVDTLNIYCGNFSKLGVSDFGPKRVGYKFK